MWNSIKTMWFILLHMFARRVTIQYPEEMPKIAPRWRGRIILSRDPDGGESEVRVRRRSLLRGVRR